MDDLKINLAEAEPPSEFLERIPLSFAREHAIVAARKFVEDECVCYLLACARPERAWVADRIAYKLDAQVKIVAAAEEDVLALIARAYHAESKDVAKVADEIAVESATRNEIRLSEDVLELNDKAPAVKLAHAMLLQAARQRASDVHIEPEEQGLRVRFRIDGVLYDRAFLRREARDGVVSRIKVMGKMDIAERRLPQDGGVTIRIGERQIDLRIASLPTQHGERIVMRLLDKTTGLMSLDSLGLESEDRQHLRKLLELTHGIILVTGPTGCGKTTTLYAMLAAINSTDLSILTLEDPIEYQLPRVAQTQVSEKKGLTFARGLRALVRQDPDIIMVGEIRDLETATVAIQSALTGHLVLSTLHTNDAPSSVTRLLDIGVEPYLVSSSVNAVIAQRLARLVCQKCRKSLAFDLEMLQREGWARDDLDILRNFGASQISQRSGCEACFETGFSGRTGIYEFLIMNDYIRELIMRRAPAGEIKKAAVEKGMITLRRGGLRKVARELTTLDEVRAITQIDME